MQLFKQLKYLVRYILLDLVSTNSRIRELRHNQDLSSECFEEKQERLLRATLISAKQRLPAYSHMIIPDSNIKKFISTSLPVITKADLLQQREQFYPNLGKKKTLQIVGKTSGTTGTPLDIFRSLNSISWENAFVKRHWLDIAHSVRRATLRGDQVAVSVEQEKYWFYNDVDKQLVLSSKHLTEKTFPIYAAAITNYKPTILQAYPSMAFQLAKYCEAQQLNLQIPYVFTASEMLYGYQRELIERHLGQVCDFYGMAERVAMATECQFKNLHLNTDYSYVEILDDNNQPTVEEGYIVGTTMHNEVMPLIRYKLSDRTKWKPGTCACGSHYPMIEPISGKFEDLVYDVEQKAISPSLITFAFKGVLHIKQSQVAQVAVDQWIVRIVPDVGFQQQDGLQIISNINQLVSEKVNVEIELVDDIPRTSAGKYRWVINEMSKKKVDLRND